MPSPGSWATRAGQGAADVRVADEEHAHSGPDHVPVAQGADGSRPAGETGGA